MGRIHPEGVAAENATHKSDAIYDAAIGRKPAFPLYLLCTADGERFMSTCDYEPGRIVLTSDPTIRDGMTDGVLSGNLAKALCSQDVVWVNQATDYPENRIALTREMAPHVSAILLGTGGPELGIGDPVQAATDEARTAQILTTTEFVKRTGGEIRDMGGRPAYGITHFTTLLHCYWAPRHMPGGIDPLVQAAQDLDALFIDFLGFAFWLSPGVLQPLDHWDPTSEFIRKDYLDAHPFAQLKAWHEQFECWGGVDYIDGLAKGYDVPMAAGGFKAGVIGELPPSAGESA